MEQIEDFYKDEEIFKDQDVIIKRFQDALRERNMPEINALLPTVVIIEAKLADEVSEIETKIEDLKQVYHKELAMLRIQLIEGKNKFSRVKKYVGVGKTICANIRKLHSLDGGGIIWYGWKNI